jgi:dihydrofolate reductase
MHVFLIAAQTLDGFIARSETESSFDWTTPEDKTFYIQMIKRAMHMVVGSTTLKTFRRFPRDMRVYVYTRQPEKFDSSQLSQAAVYEPTKESPQDLVARLTAEGVEEVAICGGASIYTQFLTAGVVNTLYLTVEPVLFGTGVRLFSTSDPITQRLQLKQSSKLNEIGTILLEYEVLPAGKT